MAQQPREAIPYGDLLPSMSMQQERMTEGATEELSGMTRRRFVVTEAGPQGRSVTVTTAGPAPTLEEQVEILNTVYGVGKATKQQLPGVGGGVGSLLATEGIKRAYVSRAAPGLATMGLRAAAKKVPLIAAGAGVGGMIGEGMRQAQIPNEIGRFRLIDVGDTAMLGQMDVSWDPTSRLSRAKMIGLRGAEEAGLDVVGGLAMKGVGALGRGLYGLGMRRPGSPMADLMSRTGGTAREDTLRIGEEGRRELLAPGGPWPTQRGPGRTPDIQPRMARSSGWGLGLERELPLRPGLQQIGRIGPQATEAGWGQFRQLPAAMKESAQASRRLVEPLKDVTVEGLHLPGLRSEILASSAPKGTRLDQWLQINDALGLAENPQSYTGLSKKLLDLIKRYVVQQTPGPDPMVFATQRATLGNVMDDVAFLEGHLDELYNLRNQGKFAEATPALLIAKAIRDALSGRVDRTIANIDPDIHSVWTKQRKLSQQLGVALDLVKGSPDTLLTGVAVGATAVGGLGGMAAGSGGTGLIMAAPVAVLGGSPPISARVGQSLFNRRLSTIPQTGARIMRGLTGPSMTPAEPMGAAPTVENILREIGGGIRPTGDPAVPLDPRGPGGDPLTLEQAQLLQSLLGPR